MTSTAKTVNEYLAGLPADRREPITAVCEVIGQVIARTPVDKIHRLRGTSPEPAPPANLRSLQ